MKQFRPFAGILIATVFGLAGVVHAADLPAKKAPPKMAATTPPTCSSAEDFFLTNCLLSWYGVTIYGIVDAGVGWQSHGAAWSPTAAVANTYLVSKYGNSAHFGIAANGLSNSNIGIKGNKEFAPGWNFLFDLQAGFDPYSLQPSDGPRSVLQNAGVPLIDQSTNADSSRAGQFFNSVGYLGVSSPTYGTLTVFRQNSLTLDGVFAYDPLGASYAFSPIGYQGLTCGVGNTQDCRYSTSLKYRLNIGQFRVAALWQFGGYEENNAANGAYQIEVGGDVPNLWNGTLSLDAIYSQVRDAVSVANAGNPLSAAGAPLSPFLPQVYTATISDNSSIMLLARYTSGPFKLYGGYERIQFAPPSDPQTSFIDISGEFVCLGCAAINNTNINNTAYSVHDKIHQVLWAGVKYSATDTLDFMFGYYRYLQNSFGAVACSTAALATCSGTLDAVAFAADWKFAAKFDAYAGFMYSQVNNGLASGFLFHNNIDPTAGIRFQF